MSQPAHAFSLFNTDYNDRYGTTRYEIPNMKSINAATFDQPLQDLLDHIDTEDIIITKNGDPVAKVIKFNRKSTSHLIGSLKDKIEVRGDIFSTGIHYPEDCHKYNRDEGQP